ncbi:MAG TPA: hypothetical protein VGR72_09575 [Candidatus Acidoferrales bacterium]|nr:hypothetical protein [Candidatus Acidoferrales bacterium]
MPTVPRRLSRPEVESKVLHYICDSTADRETRKELLGLLLEYTWLDADNEILYESIRVLFDVDPQRILLHLPSILTRRGFPDISCKPLTGPSLLSSMAAICLAGDLLRLGQRDAAQETQ